MKDEIILEQRLTMLETKLDNITESVKEISQDIKDHVRWEAEKYEKLDTKYSGKWVETLTVGIACGLVVAVAAYFITK